MALIDVDRHILMELTILSEKQTGASHEFRIAWEQILEVRAKASVLIDTGDVHNGAMAKLREEITRAIRVCSTKMAVIDDSMSRQSALLKHMVSLVESADTKKGMETHDGTNTSVDSSS